MKRLKKWTTHINRGFTQKRSLYCLFLPQNLLPLQRNNEENNKSIRPNSLVGCL